MAASPLGPTEQYRWQLTQISNNRGVKVDIELCRKTLAIAKARLAVIQTELQQVTGGAVRSVQQVQATQKWLKDHGCELPNLQANTIEKALERDDWTPEVFKTLTLRAEAAHSLKAKSLLRCCDPDSGRIYGTMVYAGAGTGRLASHSPNLQNLHREAAAGDTALAVTAILTGDLAAVASLGPVMQVLSETEQALLVAGEGNRFFDGDWSGQESRIGAWLCGAIWKRDAWEESDRSSKPEDQPYFQIGAKCDLPPGVSVRDFGKALDLACQYGSGAERVKRQMLKTLDLPADFDFERCVQIWRAENQDIVRFWKRLQSCAVAALRRPGAMIDCGRLTFWFDGTFLKMRLPSGRMITYPFAREGSGRYGDAVVIFKDAQQGRFEDCNDGNGFWGGSLLENSVQAIGSDVLMDAVVRLEEAGYPVVLTIHDQVLVEMPKNEGSVGEFRCLIERRPTWAPDLPLAVKVRSGPRLAKIDLPVTNWAAGSWDDVPVYTAQHKVRPKRPKAERPPKPPRPKVVKPDQPGSDRPARAGQPAEPQRPLSPTERAARWVAFVRREAESTDHLAALHLYDRADPAEAARMRARDAERLALALAWNGEGTAPDVFAAAWAPKSQTNGEGKPDGVGDPLAAMPGLPGAAIPEEPRPEATPSEDFIADQAGAVGAPDRDEAAHFLALLDPGAVRFTFQTFDDDKDRKLKSLARIIHGSLSECFAELAWLNSAGAGIFVTINETDFKGRTIANIVRVRALFADFDGGAALPTDGPQPFLIVQSSETGRHLYWKPDNIALDAFTATQELIIKRFSSDPKPKDLPRVMRLPGFLHRKSEPFMTRILDVHEDALVCSAADFGTVSANRDEIPEWIKADVGSRADLGGAPEADADPWRELNSLALASLGKWVPELFGETAVYQPGTGAYRVSSKALGRDLEEDLSIHPDGIVDFGVADQGDEREGKRSPIDIVMEFQDVDEDTAFDWLDAQLRGDTGQGEAGQTGGTQSQASAKQLPELDEWDAGDLLSGPLPVPRQWLIGGIFCRSFLSGLVAPGDVGKTTLRLTQAIELATGRELLGLRVYAQAKVLVISFEDDRAELHRRLLAICQHHGIAPAELKSWLFCRDLNGGAKLAELDARGRRRQIGALDGMLRRAIARTGCSLAVLDPFVKVHALNESDNPDMDFVCSLLIKIAQDCNIGVDSPAHTHKGQIQAGDADARRGASAQRDAGRLDYTLTVMSEDEAKQFGIAADERKRYMRLDKAKANIVRAVKARWFRLISVRLNNADSVYIDGDEVQAIERWEPPETWADAAPEALNAILDAIDAGLPDGRRYSDHSKAKGREAWQVVQKHCPGKGEAQCREMIRQWVKAGVLVEKDYDDPTARKPRKGLFVDSDKRPHY
jgi:hypothetical protein